MRQLCIVNYGTYITCRMVILMYETYWTVDLCAF